MAEKKFTPQQMSIVAEIVQIYDTDPADITFFTDAAEPFIGYETACVMLNRLAPDLKDINIEPVFGNPDVVSVKVILTDEKGRSRSGLGSAHTDETDELGKLLDGQRLQYLAVSRGLRSAMRMAGIDLLRLHRSGVTVAEFSGPDASAERNHLSRQLHALAAEVGYIQGTERAAYSKFLMHRYGVSSSTQLSDELLRDAVAALSALRPPVRMAA